MHKESRIFIAGHRGLVGSAIRRRLEQEGYSNLILRTHGELDLRDRTQVDAFFAETRPEYVFLAAGKVGGIWANQSYPAQFIYDNLAIVVNVVDSAYRHGVSRLQALGSSCIYPRLAPQPIREEYLLSGELEPTNEPYAIAKIAGLKLAQAYTTEYGFNTVSLMPTNLYGPGDNFDLQNSHVLPALLRRFHEATLRGDPEVVVWGTGNARREFLHADDLADAAVFIMGRDDLTGLINVGAGDDVTIRQLAELIAGTTGYRGRISFDHSKPDGTPRKLLDSSRLLSLGWRPRIALEDGLRATYAWYRANTARGSAA